MSPPPMDRTQNPVRGITFLAAAVLAGLAVVGGRHREAPEPSQLAAGSRSSPPVAEGPSAASAAGERSSRRRETRPVLELADFLPENAVRDASVDYTPFVQAALDAAEGRTLRLAPFPVRVSRRADSRACLVVRKSMSIEGSPGSMLVDAGGDATVLSCDAIDGLHLSGFTLRGACTGPGERGILEVNGGSDIVLEGVEVQGGDSAGIVVLDAADVRISGCSRASVTGRVD